MQAMRLRIGVSRLPGKPNLWMPGVQIQWKQVAGQEEDLPRRGQVGRAERLRVGGGQCYLQPL